MRSSPTNTIKKYSKPKNILHPKYAFDSNKAEDFELKND